MLGSTLFLVGEYTIIAMTSFVGFAGIFRQRHVLKFCMLVREYTRAFLVAKIASMATFIGHGSIKEFQGG